MWPAKPPLHNTFADNIQLPGCSWAFRWWQLHSEDVKGPPITVKCECGELKHVPYGEVWECEQCGRRWNTNQIPAEEYDGLLREMRRFRLSAIGAAVVLGAGFGLLAIFVSQSLFLMLPAVLGLWYIWYMPFWRRKVRRRARNLPTWQLTKE